MARRTLAKGRSKWDGRVTLEAYVKWGSCQSDVTMKALPTDFAKAKRLWRAKRIEEACALVTPFVRCSFDPDPINGDITEILDIRRVIKADEIIVYGVDFTGRSLPFVKAAATFNVRTRGTLTKKRLEEWEEENGYLDNGVNFQWSMLDDFDDPYLHNLWEYSELGLSSVSVSGSDRDGDKGRKAKGG